MRPRERLLRTLRGLTADRVPLRLPGLHFRSREEIANLDDPFKRRLAERIFDQTDFTVVVPAYTNRMLMIPNQRVRQENRPGEGGFSDVHGVIDTPRGELTYHLRYDPNSNTHWQVKYPVECDDDLEKIASVPWETPKGLAAPDAENLPEGFEERGVLATNISSPFVCVAGMMAFERFLEMTVTDPEWIAELTETCRRRTLDCLDVLFSAPGIEYVWVGGSEWVTPPMGSNALYDALVQEQERSLIERIRRANPEAVVHVHCHGRVGTILERTIERGASYTEPVEPPPDGDITMAEAKALARGRMTLGGNVEARVLFGGSEEETEAATRAAFEGGKERFVLRPSEGPSPRMSEGEFRNYQRMLDVWEELSPIA